MPARFASTRARAGVISLLLLATLPDCTCADQERQTAHLAYIQSEVDVYVHAGAREELAADARRLLLRQGFELPPWDGDGRATTPWREDGTRRRKRWHVDASAQDGGAAVRLTAETQQCEPAPESMRDSRRRDLELELEVLGRLAPERAAKVKVEDVGQETYEIDSATAWAQIEASLAERGEQLRERDQPVDITVTSEWAVHFGDEPWSERHDVQLVSAGPPRYRIELHRVIERHCSTRGWTTIEERRDVLLELELVRRRDPTAASAIETEARRRGQQAYDEAIDDGAFACRR